jgi:hypothetical protein
MIHRALIIFFIAVSCMPAGAQIFQPGKCDSLTLTADEFRKCKLDDLFEENLVAVINYATYLKKEVLPPFRKQRQELHIPKPLKDSIRKLKAVYDSVLNYKIAGWSTDMDRNQKFVQPKAFAASLLQMELFRIYPDIYAVLLNPIHLNLRPKSDPVKVAEIEMLVERVYQSVSSALKHLLEEQSTALNKQQKAYANFNALQQFQGDVSTSKRAYYQLINYLIWIE